MPATLSLFGFPYSSLKFIFERREFFAFQTKAFADEITAAKFSRAEK